MGLFSLFRQSKDAPTDDDRPFRSRASAEDDLAPRSRAKRRSGKDGAVDPVLPEKKRARRRLIGAIALALGVVVVLPMLLDSEPKPLTTDIAIDIPSRDQPASASAPAPSLPSADTGQASAAADTPRTDAAEPPPLAAPAPTPAPKPIEKPQDPPVAKLTEKPAPAPEKPAAKADANAEAQRVRALLEGRTAPAAAAGRFTIQVAALSSPDKVQELQTRLKGAGVSSYTQKVATQSGEATRIRVGPFNNRDDADKMLQRLVKLGFGSSKVVPD